MESPSGPKFGKLSSSGLSRGRTPKHGHPQEQVRSMSSPENHSKHSPVCDEPAEGKRKGRPKAEMQELRSIPATVAEKLSHGCPYCEAVFATKVRLQKHKLWNHPDRANTETKVEQPKLQKTFVKSNTKKRPMEISPPSPVFFKVKKTHEVSTPSQNGELAYQKNERKQHSHSQPSQQIHQTQPVQPLSQQSQSQSTSSDAGGSESEGGSLPPSFPDEDPERMKHRRKQKTPKKFTGEQPSISGTFGLKGMTKVEEKLKAGRVKRTEGSGFAEEPQRRPPSVQTSKKDSAPTSSGVVLDAQWQRTISERGEVVCPTCSIVTRKTIHGLKKHMEICQKLQDALKCQQCHKQFRSKAGLNYHTMAEHSSKPSGSEGQTGNEHEERERLRRVLKQMGRIKCPSEGCSAHFSSLMGYQYHQQRCGREYSDDAKPVFLCQHCGKNYRSKAGRDYHVRTEHSPAITTTTTTAAAATNLMDSITDTNNNTGKERVISEECPSGGKKEQSQTERKEWQERTPSSQPKEKDREAREKDREKEKGREQNQQKAAQTESQGEDFERTPSGRVRRRSAQVAVFHLQEIAEDELAKDWGTKRRIKDDLVPDSKRLNYTRPGLPSFSPELLEAWKNQVKEKGFICCTNENCEAVYSSVSGLKAHLANCSKGGGEMGKYTCLICQKEFSSESGVKYHISKTHSQNWFRAAASQVVSSSKSKVPENNGIKAEVRNGATTGKKRGRKPKERPPVNAPLQTKTEALSTQNSSPAVTLLSGTAQPPTLFPDPTDSDNSRQNRQPIPSTNRRNKPKRLSLSE
ncbi:zinc finger protein 512B isoform X3 [Archocentrus centrarchus]|uniref:zinc finger protein 512B isoform X3 n=1 Tax=Archocentrus centrarchus TaxID=63155 RepID=UPI0011EA1B15|nr:zinc finger protein 512B isoform X3 [Archocentrus centrarchus]